MVLPTVVTETIAVGTALERMRAERSCRGIRSGCDRVNTWGLSIIRARKASSTDSGAKASAVASAADARVAPDALLEELIAHTARTDVPVAVVDEGNRLVGSVDRTAIMLAIEGSSTE